jgi:DnaJ family protein A protein 2
MDKADQCKKCKGNKIVDDTVELDVILEPGVYHDFDIKFSGEGDEAPGV